MKKFLTLNCFQKISRILHFHYLLTIFLFKVKCDITTFWGGISPRLEVGDRRKFGDQGTNLRNFWEKSNIRLRLISELMEKSKSQPSSKSPPQYWTPNHEVQKPTFNTNFAKFYKENYKSYSRKMYFLYIFLKTSIKVWLSYISDKTLWLKFGFMNTAMRTPKPNS